MLSTLKHQVWRRARAAYYAFGLARLPLGAALGRSVSAWETAQGFGDNPKAKSTWDAEYSELGRQVFLCRSRCWPATVQVPRFLCFPGLMSRSSELNWGGVLYSPVTGMRAERSCKRATTFVRCCQ